MKSIWMFCICVVMALASCTKPDRSEEADRLTAELNEEMFKNPEHALARVDSAEQAGVFRAVDANANRFGILWNSGKKQLAAFYGEKALADPDLKRGVESYYSTILMMVKWYTENGEYGKAAGMADRILAEIGNDNSARALTTRSSALTRKAKCKIHTGHPDVRLLFPALRLDVDE